MKRSRRTKIIATLGPASDSAEMMAKLFEAGADTFRLNMSHLARDRLREKVGAIREIEARARRPIAILADLQGPKLRVGTFGGDAAMLKEGTRFVLDSNESAGDAKRVFLPHPEILGSLEEGHSVLVDDGKLRLEVEEVKPGRAVTRVAVGGKISNRKGVNLPDTEIPVAAMTEKDRTDLEAAIDAGVDWIGMSFVQRPEDVAEGRKMARGRALIMTKLEKPQAISRLDDILDASDAVMVARGDLGVELPPEDVPPLQNKIVACARQFGKPVVVATQMLESMVNSPSPTRAEVSDVATAIYDGADAVMLSAESASGKFPVESVAMMDRIIAQTEADPHYRDAIEASHTPPAANTADAIGWAARSVAGLLDVAAMVAYTSSGTSALRMARERPRAPIIGMTPKSETARRLALVWGVNPVVCKDVTSVADMTELAVETAVKLQFAQAGQTLVIAAGMPFGTSGTTNLLRIAQID